MKFASKPLFGLLALAMLLVAQSAAAFTHYPNATCPDTMSIFYLKTNLDLVGTCKPQDQASVPSSAPGDTIYGVGGIVIGFDDIPTGFDMFIQTTGGGPNTGLDVFTHGQPLHGAYGLNLGDSLIVEFGGVADFQGDKELEGPNNNFANPDIVLRKVSSGNPLPPFFVGTTTDLRELPTNTTFAPYVSALVHLNGPLHVARVSTPTNTMGLASPSYGMLVVNDAAPNDSVFIDLQKCLTMVPPPVGTPINSIQGIGNKATRGFRIMPRNSTDIDDNVPPNVADAYAISDNQYRIIFDRTVTSASAGNKNNYTLNSFGSVDAAAIDGTSAAILTVSGTGLTHGLDGANKVQTDFVNVSGIVNAQNGQTMVGTQSSLPFVFGALTCGEMSQPNPDTLAAANCVDKSAYSGPGGEFSSFGVNGPRSTVTGIVTLKSGNLYYMEDGTPDPAVSQHNSRGITAFASPVPLTLGHRYVIAGACQDFWQENEFTAIAYVRDAGTPGIPAAWTSLTPDIMALGDPCDATPSLLASGDAPQAGLLTARDYLSTLVTMTNLKVVAKQVAANQLPQRLLNGNNGFWVAGPSTANPDTFIVENLNNNLGPNSSTNPNYPPLYSHINVTGVVHFINNPANPNNANNARSFRICPASAAGIVTTVGVGDAGSAKLSFSAFPNPGHMVNLSFSLPRSTNVDLAVYDLLGRKVVQLAKGTYPGGTYQKSWNGTNSAGAKVGSGVYFYRLRAGDEVRTTRTLLLSN
jgi:hypothetical protein